jgi:hypothetical protein
MGRRKEPPDLFLGIICRAQWSMSKHN